MEQCAWISPEDEIPGKECDVVFIGDETCGRDLSSGLLLRRANAVLRSGRRVGLIAPYLTPNREVHLARMLSALPEPVQVVVNDVGALTLVRKSAHKPVIGRLLARQQSDPAITSFFGSHPPRTVCCGEYSAVLEHRCPAPALAEHFAGSPVFSDEAAALFLSGYDAMTVMLDVLPHGMPQTIPQQYSVLLNLGSVFLSALPCRDCANCPRQEVLLGTTRAGVPIYRKKNTCYYRPGDLGSTSPTIHDYVSGLLWDHVHSK